MASMENSRCIRSLPPSPRRRRSPVIRQQVSQGGPQGGYIPRRDQDPVDPLAHRLGDAPGAAGQDGHPGAGGLEQGDPKALHGGRVDQQVQAREQLVQIVPEADEPDQVGEPHGGDLRVQFCLQGALTEEQDPQPGVGFGQVRQDPEQESVPLARDQLGHHAHQERIGGYMQLGRGRDPIAGSLIAGPIHGAAHDLELFRRQALGQQDLPDALGDGHHPVMEPVFQGHQPRGLRVVHPPGMDNRGPGQAGGDAAHHICPDATVQVHQVWAGAADQADQAPGEAQVRVAAHGQAMDLRKGRCCLAQGAARRAGEQVDMAPRGQALQQVEDLLRPAVEAFAALYVQDLQAVTSSETAPAFPTCGPPCPPPSRRGPRRGSGPP